MAIGSVVWHAVARPGGQARHVRVVERGDGNGVQLGHRCADFRVREQAVAAFTTEGITSRAARISGT
eukprot:scaffold13394_cov79-Phaeocystis_antarctica.AAC.2